MIRGFDTLSNAIEKVQKEENLTRIEILTLIESMKINLMVDLIEKTLIK